MSHNVGIHAKILTIFLILFLLAGTVETVTFAQDEVTPEVIPDTPSEEAIPTEAPTEIPTEAPTEVPPVETTEEATPEITETPIEVTEEPTPTDIVPTEEVTVEPTVETTAEASAPPVFNIAQASFEAVPGQPLEISLTVSDDAGIVRVVEDMTGANGGLALATTPPAETAPPFNTLVAVTYLAPAEFSGTDTFVLNAIDAAGESASVTISVNVIGAEATAEVTPETTPVLEDGLLSEDGLMADLTFTVNVNSDDPDIALDGVCDSSAVIAGDQCSLRAAIQEANNAAGLDTIDFDIPGPGPFSITLTSGELPAIASPVIIDGYTQSGAQEATASTVAIIRIEINGTDAGTGDVNGLTLTSTASGSTIQGIAIKQFASDGIELNASDNNIIRGNYLGLEVEGSIDFGNSANGIFLTGDSDNNQIGGTDPSDRNLISGNQKHGIEIGSSANTNLIQGNYIGLEKTGLVDRGNLNDGIFVNGGSTNTIGGTVTGAGNVISGNDKNGIEIFATNTTVQGNIIGLTPGGTARVPNTLDGILISGASNNLIGGTEVGARNVITGNNSDGIEIARRGTTPAPNNFIQGNYIGISINGTALVTTAGITGNSSAGIRLNNVSSNKIGVYNVGETTVGAGNVISGNQGSTSATTVYGIIVISANATNNVIGGNYIGTNAAGTGALPNRIGVRVENSFTNIIGGYYTPQRNIISGNLSNGVEIAISSTSNRIIGNYIGTDVSGTGDLGNGGDGVLIYRAPNNFVGGTFVGERNVIAGNSGDGVKITGFVSGSTQVAETNRVQDNYIGTNASGGALANDGNGVRISDGARRNQVGLDPAAEDPVTALGQNVISFNGLAGVLVENTAGTGNSIMKNVIRDNGGMGIDLGTIGHTPNDGSDIDTGPNNLQNAPVLTFLERAGGEVDIEGALNSTAGLKHRIDFFANYSCDASGYGEGQFYLGFEDVTTDIEGNATFAITFPDSAFDTPSGVAPFITMIATDYMPVNDNGQIFNENSTSEYSRCINRNNNVPSISDIPDQTTNYATPITVNFTVGDQETAAGSLVITASSSNTDLVPNLPANLTPGGSGANRSLTVSPAANGAGGTAIITVNVTDAGGATTSDTFVLTVLAPNIAPQIVTDITDKTVTANSTTGTGNVAFTVDDPDGLETALTLTGTSNDQVLVPNINITFGGSGASRTVKVVPATGRIGTALITLTVTDPGGASDIETFNVIVNASGGNTPPTISAIADQTVDLNESTPAIPFTIGDAQTAVGSLTILKASSNTVLVPVGNIVIGGSGANRTVTVTPTEGVSGTSTITITVRDAGNLIATEDFLLTVLSPPNTAPTISSIPNQTTVADTATAPANFTVGDAQTPAAQLSLSGLSSNLTLVPNGNILFGGTGANRTVTVLPSPGQTGTANITVTVTDTGSGTDPAFSASRVFTVTVNPNTPPTITDIGQQNTTIGTPRTIDFVVGDAESPLSNLTVTGTSSDQALVPDSNIVFNPPLNTAERSVTITPIGVNFGTVTITLTVKDGTLGSSLTTSDTFSFVISENNPPTISNIPDQTTAPGVALGPLEFNVSDPETPDELLDVTATSNNQTLLPDDNITVGGTSGARILNLIPTAGQAGTAVVTVMVTDSNGASETDTFTLNVVPPAPIPNLPANLSTIGTIRPQFTWSAVTGVTRYRLQVSTDQVFATTALEQIVTSTSYTIPTTNPGLAQGVYYWRVRGIDINNAPLTDWSTKPVFTIALQKTPLNRSFTTDTTPTFTWNAVTGATYTLQVDDDSAFGSPVANFCTSNTVTSCTPTAALPANIYYWRVNLNGSPSAVSWTLTVTTSVPTAPTLVDPPTNKVTNDSTPDLFWNAVSGTGITYEVQVDDQTAFNSPEFSPAATSLTQITVSPALPDGKYSWRVRALNDLNVPGPWSLVRVFTIDTSDPAAPEVIGPLNNLITNDTTPTFSWKAVLGATSYRLDIATDENFTSFAPGGSGIVVIKSPYTPVVSNNLSNGQYWWRVQALDAAGNQSDYTLGGTFTVSVLKTPLNGVFTTDTTPTFTWNAVTGATYQLQVDNNEDFGSPLAITCLPTALTCTVPNATPLSFGTYYWRVNVNGVPSLTWVVTVSPPPPLAPAIIVPKANAFTNDNTPTVSWKPVAGANLYEVQVDNDATFVSPIFTRADVNTTYTTVTPSLPDGIYSVRVRALNIYGSPSAWSKPIKFTVDTAAPAAPALTAPIMNAVLTDNTPVLSWKAVTGANRYRVELASDPSFLGGTFIINGAIVATTSYTVPNAVALENGNYWWRIRSIDAAGNLGPASEVRTFRVNAP